MGRRRGEAERGIPAPATPPAEPRESAASNCWRLPRAAARCSRVERVSAAGLAGAPTTRPADDREGRRPLQRPSPTLVLRPCCRAIGIDTAFRVRSRRLTSPGKPGTRQPPAVERRRRRPTAAPGPQSMIPAPPAGRGNPTAVLEPDHPEAAWSYSTFLSSTVCAGMVGCNASSSRLAAPQHVLSIGLRSQGLFHLVEVSTRPPDRLVVHSSGAS